MDEQAALRCNKNLFVTGIIENWTLHIEQLTDAERAAFTLERPGYLPAVLTGLVIRNYLRRWNPGEAMRNSLVVAFDLENMTVVTQNSIYQLSGPGDIVRQAIPSDYAAAVGATIMRLSRDGIEAAARRTCRPPYH